MTHCCSTWVSCLQDLNPIPFPIVVANCVAWVAYAVVNKDPYVFLANDPGILLGLFYTLSAYGYADVKVQTLFVTTVLVTKNLVLTSNCPCSEGPLQSKSSDWLPMAFSLRQDCPYIECPYNQSLLYCLEPRSDFAHASCVCTLNITAGTTMHRHDPVLSPCLWVCFCMP